MSISLLVLLFVPLVLFLYLYVSSPQYCHILFPHLPGFARINVSKDHWEEERRTVLLLNDDSKAIYIILAGTPTDFASILRLAHSLIFLISNSVYGAVSPNYFYRIPNELTVKHQIINKLHVSTEIIQISGD